MPIFGVTGGVASGKSTFTKLLAELAAADVFDSDLYVHELLRSSAETITEITEQFGRAMVTPTGEIDRKRLGTVVFQDLEKRRILESIIHPRVRAAWIELAQSYGASEKCLLIDIPLLFETEADRELPAVFTVGCSREIQFKRLTKLRGIEMERAQSMIESQMDMSGKTFRTNYLVWNDGSLSALQRQVTLCARILN